MAFRPQNYAYHRKRLNWVQNSRRERIKVTGLLTGVAFVLAFIIYFFAYYL